MVFIISVLRFRGSPTSSAVPPARQRPQIFGPSGTGTSVSGQPAVQESLEPSVLDSEQRFFCWRRLCIPVDGRASPTLQLQTLEHAPALLGAPILHDTRAMGVPVLLVVEDNIRYYSAFLPVIYTELIKQSRRVIQEGINVAHKLVRMQARPKILLSSNFEDASQLVQEYRDYLFGVVSDVEFPWNGKLSPEAGFELARIVRDLVPDAPVVLQTSRTEFCPRAHAEGYSFLRKRSPTLLRDLRQILTEHMGFGDFVFRTPDQSEVGRASDLNALEEQLQSVPVESIAYHAQRNHFSHWLMARTEFALAAKLRPRKVSDFASHEHLRRNLIASINEYRQEQGEVSIGDFKADTFKPSESGFLRIGSGSLGGKARGLAFVRHLRHNQEGFR